MINKINSINTYSTKYLHDNNKRYSSNDIQMPKKNQVTFKGLKESFRLMKFLKKVPDEIVQTLLKDLSTNVTSLHKRLTMPEELLEHNWEFLQKQQNNMQVIYNAVAQTMPRHYNPQLDKNVSEALNIKGFNPLNKVRISTSEKTINLLDIMLKPNEFNEKQNFPADILLKVLGDDNAEMPKWVNNLTKNNGTLLSWPILNNFRYRFLKTDIKKEEPKLYKRILNLYNKSLANRNNMDTIDEDFFKLNCILAARDKNKNYLEMLLDLNIKDKEEFSKWRFSQILREMSEEISPTSARSKNETLWWNFPNADRDRTLIHNAYLNK